MERRTALALATAAAGTVLAASAAFATNVGLLEHDKAAPISVLDTSSLEPAGPVDPTVVTVVVDDPPVQASNPTSPASPADATDLSSSDDSYDDGGDDAYDDSRESDDTSATSSDEGYEGRDDDD